MRSLSAAALLAVCATGLPTSHAFAQGAANNHLLRYSQAHGMTFSEIGDPGNAPSVEFVPGFGIDVVGRVHHRYRIATTEVTNAQYLRFAQALAPHLAAVGADAGLLAGHGTLVHVGSAGGVPQYLLPKGTGNEAARNTIEYFALMANWLHHGAPDAGESVASDFTSGAYDNWRDPARSEGAEFWIPSRDEWSKAAFYDPNRHGPGEGGYWLYPISSDTAPVPGDPALGGQTSAGNEDEWPEGHFKPADVGSYAGVLSPWGLLDASGSQKEWTDTRWGDSAFFVESSSRGSTDPTGTIIIEAGDRVGHDELHTPLGYPFEGGQLPITVRFAASIPSPGVPCVLGVAGLAASMRRRRCSQASTALRCRRRSF